MTTALSEEGILNSLVKTVQDRLQRQVITKLRRMGRIWDEKAGLLKSLWDEVCVHSQYGEPFGWKEIDDSVRALVAEQVGKLPAYEEAALWLKTHAGIDWICSDETERNPHPVVSNDVVEHISRDIYSAASNCTNRRLRLHGERASDQRQKRAREYRQDPNNAGYL